MIDVTLKGRTGTAAAPFYALSIERITFLGDNVPVDGETVAILSPDGDTLALGYADGGAVDLNLNTAEADGATAYLEPTETIRAALVVGDTDNVRAIVGIELGRNVLDELAPPPELAPKYPTSEALLAILAQMTAQAQRAEDAVDATEEAQKAVAEYVDEVFPAKVEKAEESLANATTKGVQAVTDKASQSVNSITAHTTTIISALDSKKTQIETSIDTKAQAVNSALDGKLSTANTAINDAVGKAEQAKSDAVKAQGEVSKSAEQASTSASNASKSAQQAEDAKNAIGDVGGRLESLETLDGVFEKRDIFGELQKALPAETNSFKHADIAIRNVATTANGNIVVYAQHDNSWNSLYVIGKDGTILAEQKSAHGISYNWTQWLVQSGDVIYFLTNTACYKITDTETSAIIESIGNLDFNGLATTLPNCDLTKVIEIDGKVILSNLVIDLATLKVVQVIASGIVATHKSNGVYATLANGTVTKLTVSSDGLIEQADFVDSNGNVAQKSANVVEVSTGGMFCFMSPSTTALTTLFVGYSNGHTQYGKSATHPMKSVISRGSKFVSIATNGNLLRNSAKIRGAASSGVVFNSIAMQMSDEAYLIGIDNGGVWAMGARTSVWAGYHPTSALVRVNF